MTRINSAIQVSKLTDEHLLAEHREIVRIPYYLDKAIKSGSINESPNEFVLGKGHVLFFVNKLKFIKDRYVKIYNECLNRGFSVNNYIEIFNNIPAKYFNNYDITNKEKTLLIYRISERIQFSKKLVFHYYGKKISKETAIKLLNTI